MDCEVKDNCNHRWDCDWCSNYNQYQPQDRKIKSPAQLERKRKKKEAKKELKNSEASKRGKRNKRAGYASEVIMVKKYHKHGFEDAERQPMSGALKGKYASDVKVTILGKQRKHEDKKRSNVETYYTRTESQTIMYDGFCVLMNEDVYFALLNGIAPDIVTVPDEKVKLLHDFFDQDNADIVSVRQHGRQKAVYAISIPFWEELNARD